MIKRQIGDHPFILACGHITAAKSIRDQVRSEREGGEIPGLVVELKYAYATFTGMAFELAIKSLMQAVADEGKDSEVLGGHGISELWLGRKELPESGIPESTRNEVDHLAKEMFLGNTPENWEKSREGFLPFADFVDENKEFFGIVDNRYGISDLSFHTIVGDLIFPRLSAQRKRGGTYSTGKEVVATYWWAIMSKALEKRWPREREDLGTDRQIAEKMMTNAANVFVN